ncbi:MAG: YtxH domain-containing protein [Actinomycetota bacterium]|nr:YtxH domain-containing protein [Actinomycetota bacterium]
MKVIRKVRNLGLAFAAGAGVAWLFDPDRGHDRRQDVAQRLRTSADDMRDVYDAGRGAVDTAVQNGRSGDQDEPAPAVPGVTDGMARGAHTESP